MDYFWRKKALRELGGSQEALKSLKYNGEAQPIKFAGVVQSISEIAGLYSRGASQSIKKSLDYIREAGAVGGSVWARSGLVEGSWDVFGRAWVDP